MRLVISTVILGACGGSGGSGGSDAATVSDASGVDAATDAALPPCDLTKPFATPVPLADLNTAEDDTWGWLLPDELTIYLAKGPAASLTHDIYVATRATTQSTFSTPTIVANVNTAEPDERPVVMPDQLTLYAGSRVTSGPEIVIATRASTSVDFSAPTVVAEVSSTAADLSPWVSNDGLTMYLSSNRGGSGNYDLYVATRTATTQPWGTPTVVTELSGTNFFELSPVASQDGLEIFFESIRSSSPSQIWRATRSATNQPWGTPVNVPELGMTGAEAPTWLSSDRCRLMFIAGTSHVDLYMATRPR